MSSSIRLQNYLYIQEILEREETAPVTQALLHMLASIETSEDTLLVQCGKGVFFQQVTAHRNNIYIVEPCSYTYIELQKQYLHLSSFGSSLYHINAENNMFESSIILYPALYLQDITNMMQELIRVTSQTLYMLFFNSYSLESLVSRLYTKREHYYYIWRSVSDIRNILSGINTNARCTFSSIGILPLGYRARKEKKYYIIPYTLGSIVCVKIELPTSRVMTPVMSHISLGYKKSCSL